MIEYVSGAARTKTQVECLTRLDEGRIELRLHSKRERRTIILPEPSAIEYARLRIQMMDADKTVNDKYPEPERPRDRIDGESDFDRAERFTDYNGVVAQWLDDRSSFRLDPDEAPYANALLAVIETLAEQTLTLGDLTPEAFKASTLQALLEVWEAPLGGPVSPPPAATPAPVTEDPGEPDELVSPESTPSSPPGGEPSPPSPPPSSTT